MLCCNITAQIPIASVHALFDKMSENTVKHHVQISPVHKNPILPVQAPKLLRVKIYHCSIRSKGTDRRIHLIYKTAQRHIQKTHSQIQLIPCNT